jgi:hypothetical protein
MMALLAWRWGAIAAVLAAALAFGWVQTSRLAGTRADLLALHAALDKARADALEAKAQREAEHREALEAVRAIYEKELTHAEAEHNRLLADLRAGTVRLRRELRCPPAADLPGAATGAAGSDGYPEVWGEIAAAAVRVGDECDAQLRAAQAVIRSDRK